MKIREEFLHYVWRMKRFVYTNLYTTEGELIKIIDAGQYNTNAGPDFQNAKIRIGGNLWVGHVEIHVYSSDWLKHRHKYENVILHVVLEEDQVIYNASGCRLPCLELKKRIPAKLLGTYRKLLFNEAWIPCQHYIEKVPLITKELWLERMLIERLQDKTTLQRKRLKDNKEDWEETFYQFLARGLGMKVNSDALDQLAQRTPLAIIRKHKNSLFQLEALFFGQAGLLQHDWEDGYPKELKKEYRFLTNKFKLIPMTGHQWNFLRLRPANFPSIRIAQLAALIYQTNHLFNKTLVAASLEELENMLELKLSNYWYNHYKFDKQSKGRFKRLGKPTKHSLIINTIIPFLFLYAEQRQNEFIKEKALNWLSEMKPERNTITKGWEKLGMEAKSAFDSQALIQLKTMYCDQKKCTKCSIGHAVLKKV